MNRRYDEADKRRLRKIYYVFYSTKSDYYFSAADFVAKFGNKDHLDVFPEIFRGKNPDIELARKFLDCLEKEHLLNSRLFNGEKRYQVNAYLITVASQTMSATEIAVGGVQSAGKSVFDKPKEIVEKDAKFADNLELLDMIMVPLAKKSRYRNFTQTDCTDVMEIVVQWSKFRKFYQKAFGVQITTENKDEIISRIYNRLRDEGYILVQHTEVRGSMPLVILIDKTKWTHPKLRKYSGSLDKD